MQRQLVSPASSETAGVSASSATTAFTRTCCAPSTTDRSTLRRPCNKRPYREDLLLTETADIADRNHLELAYWLVANGIMEVKVAIRGDRIFHNKSGIIQDAPRQSGRLCR